ncbi:ChaN family lipoprotein [Jiella avicenniae]|uniref:ChaN family lipoprotein n=1 Tax=Jiella avicenniae TaxID=2907202 RepID=A0A9X1P3Y9_9HYPH|nr:ChaN family lipoprotein [Jiella avicenniae]MCE7029855.1 ChaN family lipoprotein [Jiella avicenniae]
MKRQYWIVPSLAAVLGGIGYGVAQNLPPRDAADLRSSVQTAPAPVPAASADEDFTPPTLSDRVSLGYRRKGDENFAEVRVSTVEPFVDGVDRRLVASVADGAVPPVAAASAALAPTASRNPGSNGATAFLTKVAAAGDAAAAADMNAAETADAISPAFEATPLSSRLLDADEPAWQSRFFADNPLVGGIFQGDGNRADAASLIGAARTARYVLLGETHDNPDHHRLQSDIVADLADATADLSLVFEMIPPRLGSAVSAFGTPRAGAIDMDSLADRLEWSARGWPDFSMYRPMFETARREGLAVFPGNLDRDVVSSIAQSGISALSPEMRTRLSLDAPADPEIVADLTEEVRSAHCGLMPEGALATMADAQRARDGAMAAAMIDAAQSGDKAVLIAGSGHVRDDRGVPSILQRTDPEAETISVRMLEVDGKDGDPADYGLKAEMPAPYDFTIFTPRADRDDPCEALRARMEKKAGTVAN